MSVEAVDAVVIGAGVVGLACARAMAMAGLEVMIVERNDGIGQETSSRNSEVIHAGLYYPPDTYKADLCVRGNRALYDYCSARGIAHRRCGKLVVAATAAQTEALEALHTQAQRNGAAEARLITQREARELEPALKCAAALHSPMTGIVDSHGLMVSLLGDAENHGALLALHSEIVAAEVDGDRIALHAVSGGETTELSARLVANAAGLAAPTLAQRFAGLERRHVPQTFLAKGNYFSRLIYPIPEPGGLGVHLTLDLNGQARFGPDVEWIEDIEYTVDPRRAEGFYAEIRNYWPDLKDGALQPAYSGIRPKLTGRGEPNTDFLIQGPEIHGIPRLVNLFGIESPGLTACLSIAEEVVHRLV